MSRKLQHLANSLNILCLILLKPEMTSVELLYLYLHLRFYHFNSLFHCICISVQQYMDSTNHLKELYEDKDGFRKEEIASISGPNDFTEFYNRLKSVKDFHRQHPHQVRSSYFYDNSSSFSFVMLFFLSWIIYFYR